jgi:hypothetical protein
MITTNIWNSHTGTNLSEKRAKADTMGEVFRITAVRGASSTVDKINRVCPFFSGYATRKVIGHIGG